MALDQTSIAALAQAMGVGMVWDQKAPPSGAKPRAPVRTDPAAMARISADPILRALSDLGLVQYGPRPSSMGASYDIECPWMHQHSQRAGSGAIYTPVRTKFKCQHDHCKDRHYGDLYQEINRLIREDSMDLKCMAHYEFDEVDPNAFPLPRIADPETDWVNDTVYLSSEPRQNFWSIKTRSRRHDIAHNATWGQRLAQFLPEAPGSTAKKPRYLTPAQWYLRHKRARYADGFIHWPGEGPVMRRAGKLLANRWQPNVLRPVASVTEDMIAPWVNLIHHVVGIDTLDQMENTELLKDWLAMVVGCWNKPGWFPLITGPQGLGKDAVTLPIRQGLGVMATEIAGSEIGGTFNAWALKRFVVVNELRQTTRGQTSPHDQMNALKLWDNTRETVVINEKFTSPYEAANVFTLWITSNERIPIRLEEDDRRVMVIDRHGVAVRKDLIQHYFDWLDVEDPASGRKGWELVHGWLIERWHGMDDYRKAALRGTAPTSEAKDDLIAVNRDEVHEWMRNCIEARSPAPEAWPDIVNSSYVQKRMTQAARDGDGLSPRTVVPSTTRIAAILRDIGCERLNQGRPVYVHGSHLRLWACRDASLYTQLDAPQLVKVAEKMISASGLTDYLS